MPPKALDAECPVLSFERVGRRYRDGARTWALLEDVSFELWAGESLGVYGPRRSGKSTLLRVAAGIDVPDEGRVLFEGVDLDSRGVPPPRPATRCRRAGGRERTWWRKREELWRGPIALVAEDLVAAPGETVMDRVATARGASGSSLEEARRAALSALDRVGGAGLCALRTSRLSAGERALVALAGALVREPRLLLVDEPAALPGLAERERFCTLLREVAREREIALFVVSEDMVALQGMAALGSLAGGELCMAAPPTTVVPFPRRPTAGEL
jgi:putative ABC transport system ATP-binding protein